MLERRGGGVKKNNIGMNGELGGVNLHKKKRIRPDLLQNNYNRCGKVKVKEWKQVNVKEVNENLRKICRGMENNKQTGIARKRQVT